MVEIGTKVKINNWGGLYSGTSEKSSIYNQLLSYSNFKKTKNKINGNNSARVENNNTELVYGTIMAQCDVLRGAGNDKQVYLIGLSNNHAAVMAEESFDEIAEFPKENKPKPQLTKSLMLKMMGVTAIKYNIDQNSENELQRQNTAANVAKEVFKEFMK